MPDSPSPVKAEPGSGIYACRDFYSHFFTNPNLSGSLAGGAWMRYGLTVTIALVAGCSYSKKSLIPGNLPGAITLPAGFRMGVRFALASPTGRARLHLL